MFDAIRKHRKILFAALILVIFPSFVLFGIEGYTRMRDNEAPVAKVAGEKITRQEFDAAHRSNIERLRQVFGAQFDVKLADTPQARKATLDELVQQRVLQKAMKDGYLSVSDERLREAITEIPAIRQLIKPDGSLDMEGYRRLLAEQRPPLTPEMFDLRMRQGMAQEQVVRAVIGSHFTTASESSQVLALRQERREIQLSLVKAADLAGQVTPVDADLQDFYEKNQKQFEVPESAEIEYIVLTPEAVQAQIALNADDVKTYYEQNKTRYTTDEQRRASHILIAASKDAKPEERAAAKAKAEGLLAEARKSPNSFADLAKKNSQDPGSAERGGDLEFFGRGAMVKPFEDATFALKDGEISNVVESDFGYHIIRLTGVKPGSQQSFEQVKADIEKELKQQQATKKFSELAELMSNLVYEQADSLKPAAEKLKLTVQTAKGVTRNPNPTAGPANPLSNPRFLQSLFSDDSLKKKQNTEATEIGTSLVASGRVLSYTPATIKPLDQVKEQVRMAVIAQKSQDLAKQQGEAKLKAADSAKFDGPRVVTRQDVQGVPAQAVQAAFMIDGATLPKVTGAEVPGLGYAVVKVNKVVAAEAADANATKAAGAQLSQVQAAAEAQLYIEALKKRYQVELLLDTSAAGKEEGTATATTAVIPKAAASK
jgi:peptidyl-prolyl cis-trans isomerase D